MSMFEDQGYQWRETYLVFFDPVNRPDLDRVAAALQKISKRFELSNAAADEAGKFESITLMSPDDYAALEISYIEGEEVVEQLPEMLRELKPGALDKTEKAKLAKLAKCTARLDVLHFAQRVEDTGDEEELDDICDPGALLIALDVLVDLTHGIGVDPQSSALL